MQLVVNLCGVKPGSSNEKALYDALRKAGINCDLVEGGQHGAGEVVNVRLPMTRSFSFSSFSGPKNDDHLRKELNDKNREIKDLEKNLAVAMDSIRTFHKQQNELFDEFVSLRSKYDSLKTKMRKVLWDFIPKRVKGFESIPPIQPDIAEAEDCVGEWHTGNVLGEGQFAVVKEVRGGPTQYKKMTQQLALKRIFKDKISDVKNTIRVSNEVRILRELDHCNIVKIVDVLHTPNYLYIVQERGGLDLFEYYRKNPGPAKDSFVIKVTSQLASAISYLHAHNVTHRDLKPENVLIDADLEVKLVDFGLCTNHRDKMTLDDFCGTPGFFAPEMLLYKEYDSEKLDVWSLGCMVLEMLLGHVRFAEVWMPAYAIEQLHDPALFKRELVKCLQAVDAIFPRHPSSKEARDATVMFKNHKASSSCQRALQEQMHRSAECKSFLLSLLTIDPNSRIPADTLPKHPFLRRLLRSRSVASCSSSSILSQTSPRASLNNNQTHPFSGRKSSAGPAGHSFKEKNNRVRNSAGLQNQKLSVVTTAPAVDSSPTGDRSRFPPLSPASPKVEGLQEIVKLGDEILNKHDLHIQSL